MKNKSLLPFTLILSALMFSCYHEPNEATSESSQISFGEYLSDMAIIKGKGTILIQSNEFESIQHFENNIDISQRDGAPNSITIYDLNRNAIDINECNSNIESKRQFFGNEIEYEIENEEIKTIYFPKLLKLNFSDRIITRGSVINWNADSKNSKGIIIWLSYSPLDQLDPNLIAKHRKIITHGFTTVDTGSYIVTQDDLDKFPKNATLSLNISRTNYIINDNEKPSLIGFSTVSKDVYYTE